MHRVVEHLYISNEQSARDESLLTANEIKSVVSIGCPAAFPSKFEYKCYCITDLPSTYAVNTSLDAAEFIDAAIRKQWSVLVHCVYGQSRSVTVVIAYLMLKQGMSLADSLHVVAITHGDMCMNPGFQCQLHVLHELWGRMNANAYAEAWLLGSSDLLTPFRSDLFPDVTKSVAGSYACSRCQTLLFHDFHRFDHSTAVTEHLSMVCSDDPGITTHTGTCGGDHTDSEEKIELPVDHEDSVEADGAHREHQSSTETEHHHDDEPQVHRYGVTGISSVIQVHEYWASYRPQFIGLPKTHDRGASDLFFFAPPKWLLQTMADANSSGEVRCGACNCILGDWQENALSVCKGYAAVKKVAVRRVNLTYVPRGGAPSQHFTQSQRRQTDR